jgi:two-component system, OmpR family, sensor histidine kinase CpxA
MKLFLRTMLITWAVMSLLAILALSLPSVFKPPGERTIPIHALEKCANQAILQNANGLPASQEQDLHCPNGRLVPDVDGVSTDTAGRALSPAEVHLQHSVEKGDGLVVKYSSNSTAIAFRVGATAGQGYLYLTTIPFRQPDFLFRHLSTLSPIVIAGFLSLFVAAYVARPLTGLNAAAESFGRGDLKVRIHPPLATRNDELGDLARTFNAMAERIECLVTRYKDFLGHASHELGSPLTRLNIALALAQRKAGQDLKQEHDRISQESHRLNSLVQEMLLLARLESGNEIEKEPSIFDVQAVVAEAYENAVFESHQLTKTVRVKTVEGFVVRGYPNLLLRAVDNVLRNALRFARTHVSLEISRAQMGTRHVGTVLICDDGPGVDWGQEEAIFEPFLTLSGSEPGDNGGCGLGLAIARQAVLANGGRISAQGSPGGGLIVRIELPAEPKLS